MQKVNGLDVNGRSAPILLKTRDACRALAISPRTLWSLAKSGEIPAVRIGSAVRYDPPGTAGLHRPAEGSDRMTPYSLVKRECANFSDGVCFWQDSVCLLTPPDPRRCRYFERCILPLAGQPSPMAEPKLQAKRLKAREAYWRRFPEAAHGALAVSRRPQGLARRSGQGRGHEIPAT